MSSVGFSRSVNSLGRAASRQPVVTLARNRPSSRPVITGRKAGNGSAAGSGAGTQSAGNSRRLGRATGKKQVSSFIYKNKFIKYALL